MWVLITLFVICTLVIIWSLFGYYILLFLVGLFKSKKKAFLQEELFVSVIVPCFNEEENIVTKIENLKSQDYPLKKMEVIFVDGGSKDNTVEIIRNTIKGILNFRLMQSPEKGKINQVNYVLPSLKGEIIISTDVDGIMDRLCIRSIVNEFVIDKKIGVVGAYVYPKDTIPLESCYWDAQNKGRYLESDAFSCSIVLAPCYGFRKSLLDKFPVDVVADDIYIAYRANTMGYKVLFAKNAFVEEIRVPSGYSGFFPHKFRKANAFVRENLRFAYQLPDMPRFWKVIYTTKTVQLILLPWLEILWIFLSFALITLFRYDIVFLGLACILTFFIITSVIFKMVTLPLYNKKYNLDLLFQNYMTTTFILLSAGLSYPFIKQSSSYKKIS